MTSHLDPTLVYSSRTSGMANFPEITFLDFSVRKGLHSATQEPVSFPFHEFQFTSQFDFYRPCKSDLVYLTPPSSDYVVLRSDLAISIWESLRMKTRYILAAAYRWNGDTAASPLPTSLSDAKLEEIRMIKPAIPFLHPLTFNPLLCPGPPATVFSRVAIWQERARMLSAWICKARLNSYLIPNCSWRWPTSPMPYCDLDQHSNATDPSSTATEVDSLFSEEPVSPSHAIRVYRAHASTPSSKRPRDSSPSDPQRDGDDASKKQLVLWRPSISQLLEQQQALATGEVSSGSSISSNLRRAPSTPLLHSSSSSSLNHRNSTLDPRRRSHVTYVPSKVYHGSQLVSPVQSSQNFEGLVGGTSRGEFSNN